MVHLVDVAKKIKPMLSNLASTTQHGDKDCNFSQLNDKNSYKCYMLSTNI